ncbi:MAG: 4-hydroxybenzoate octaprenyltransferase [Parvularculaceae bacterium]|nr:4-hydroxybenzoate octaprenyltransferase [Parvularculaceae bacterium]
MSATPATPDAAPDNWVDRFASAFARPYLRLMRADRPIGTWLLYLPCLWGLAFAGVDACLGASPLLVLLFALGSIAMRGAGCAYNDIVDRDIDAKVARTARRPIPNGDVSVVAAVAFLIALSLVGLVVLLQLNRFAIGLGLASLVLVAAYPFMKRVTWWPQAWLGLTFNWGVLMGYAAVTGLLSPSAIALYLAGVAWTLGYDTIYAHQDKEDDALIGVRSTALRLGGQSRLFVLLCYAGTIGLFVVAGALADVTAYYYAALIPAALHFAWQVRRLDVDDPSLCLRLFKSNRDAGFLLLAVILLERWLSSLT